MIRSLYRSPNEIPPPRTPSYDGDGTPEYAAARRIGLELSWTNEFTLTVSNQGGAISTEIRFSRKSRELFVTDFMAFHQMPEVYMVRISQQIVLPRGFNALLLPHPRFYEPRPVGTYTDFPAVVPSLVESDWNPEAIWLHCNLPVPGTEHVYYAGEPIAHLVPVPRGDVACAPMEPEDEALWARRRQFSIENPGLSRKLQQFGWGAVRV